MLILSLLISFSVHAQVDVQKTNYLLKNILKKNYNVEVVVKAPESETYMFVPRQKAPTTLFKAREGTLLSNNSEDLDESDIIVQSWSKGGVFEFYTAQKNEEKDWELYRYTDGNYSSKNLTFCETDKKSEGFLDLRSPIYCVFGSERVCKKPLSEWPKKTTMTKEEYSLFFGKGLEKGVKEYIDFSDGQTTALRDRMSNSYKIGNFKTVNRIKEAYEMDDGFEGDAVRGAVVAQVKSLCAKAWPNHKIVPQGVPVNKKKRGAPKLQKTNQGVK